MPNLVLHIGYPKTATTTLQTSIFPQLHNAGIINYLGRWDGKSSDPAMMVRHHLLYGKDLEKSFLNFREDIPNVISDERLSLCPIYDQRVTGSGSAPTAFPDKLARIFEEVNNISLLLTLRSQRSLIYSNFLQRYGDVLGPNKDAVTFEEHIFDESGNFRYEDFKYFDFSEICRAYTDLVGHDGFRFLLFEELLNDRRQFALSLVSALGLEEATDYRDIGKWLEQAHKRKRRTVAGRHRIVQISPNLVGKRPLMKKISRYLAGSHNVFGQALFRGVRFILTERQTHEIPPQSEGESNAIAEAFRDPNLRFAAAYGVEKSKLQSYGYI